MKRVCIPYQMHRNLGDSEHPKNETAETCITLPMKDEVADEILLHGTDNYHIKEVRDLINVLISISLLQGYHFSGICTVEEEQNV